MDLPKLTQKLESLSARQTFEPIDPVTETNVQAYLKNERENAILSVIDETNRSVSAPNDMLQADTQNSELSISINQSIADI